MTEPHFEPILERLKRNDFDVEALSKTGQLVCEDAHKLLSAFMFDGIVDEHRFKQAVGNLIQTAKAAGRDRTARVFGEMVSLIWQSRQQATLRLEELWNDVIQEHSVPLLCAYALAGTKDNVLPSSLLACHSHAVA
jgi:hypothetical protein